MTKILTPSGPRSITDLRLGDTILDSRSEPQTVTRISPRATLACYRVEFRDGRTTISSGEQLWQVHHHEHEGPRVMPLSRLMERKDLDRFTIQPFAHSLSSQSLPLDPYLLGLLLGDGYLKQSTPRISTSDPEVVEAFREQFEVKARNKYDHAILGLVHTLRGLGLEGKGAEDKFIPTRYLRSSTDQRWSLLQGILDSDGTVGPHGDVTIQLSNQVLAQQIQDLVWSLGGTCQMVEKATTFSYGGERYRARQLWRLSIRFDEARRMFRLGRKLERLEGHRYRSLTRLRFNRIERVDDQPSVCLEVSAPDQLYVVDDYILTHGGTE